MHPDKKVGLALGILLIGIVGALFFRNESPDSESSIIGKAEADEIDEQIRTKPQTPYLPERNESSDDIELAEIDAVDVAELMPEISGFEQPASEPIEPIRLHPGPVLASEESGSDRITPVPLPSADGAGLDEALAAAASQRSSTPRPTEAASNREASAQPVIYEVVSGDTLSGIAARHMGSHRNWQKLYQANRDILKSPEALRPGMKLQIPGKAAPGRASDPRTDSPGPATDITGNSDRPKFEIPKRSPRRPIPRVSSRLSQTPPPDLPRVAGLEAPTIASRPEEGEKPDANAKKPEEASDSE